MSELKRIELAKKTLEEKTAAAAAAAEDAAKAEADADEQIKKTQAAITKAIADNDVSLYMEEKSRLELAQARKAMQASRKEMMGGPLISQEEYISLTDGIRADIEQRRIEVAKQIMEEAEKLYTLGKVLGDEVNDAERLLEQIHRQLFASQDIVIKGGNVRFRGLDNAAYNVAEWGKELHDGYMFKELSKEINHVSFVRKGKKEGVNQ